jgi:hypothetical protein
MTGPARVYLHIGLHKTGTTYLQNLLRANREALRRQGIEYPGGPGEPAQQMAVWDVQGRRPRGVKDKRIAGQWGAMATHIKASSSAVALLSEEHFSLSSPKQVRTFVSSFPDSEVHVIVTTRDLARIVISQWQEQVKNNRTWTWEEYSASIKDPAGAATGPARAFWLRQDLVKICDQWEAEVPAERVHIITVPSAGGSPELLLQRFCSVVGIDVTQLTEPAAWSNEAIGAPATEVIRRVNVRLDGRLNQREQDWVIKRTVVRLLAAKTKQPRASLPPEDFDWAVERGAAMIADIRGRGYDVVGDFDELTPVAREGERRPDDATDTELLEVALDALALLAERTAKMWWDRRRESIEQAGSAAGGGVADRARGAVYASQRKALELADRNPAAGKAVQVAVRIRDRVLRKQPSQR